MPKVGLSDWHVQTRTRRHELVQSSCASLMLSLAEMGGHGLRHPYYGKSCVWISSRSTTIAPARRTSEKFADHCAVHAVLHHVLRLLANVHFKGVGCGLIHGRHHVVMALR